jgi:hypothetical protein
MHRVAPLKTDITHEVRLLPRPKYSKSSVNNIPKENEIPSIITPTIKPTNITNHPQPPSEGSENSI